MPNIFTLDALNKLTPDELESLRDSGMTERQRLTDCVIAALNIPDGWQIIGEWQGEFGGLFPVHCRITPGSNETLTLTLCSPGDVSTVWLLLIQTHPAQRVRVLHAAVEFDPDTLSDLLERVDCMLRKGHSANEIAFELGESAAWC